MLTLPPFFVKTSDKVGNLSPPPPPLSPLSLPVCPGRPTTLSQKNLDDLRANLDQLRSSSGSGTDYSEDIEKLKKAIEVTTHTMENNTKAIAEHSNSLHTHSEEIEALKGKMRIVEGKIEDIESRPIAPLIPFGDFDDVKETTDDLLSPDDVVNAAVHNSLKAKVRTIEKRLDNLCQQLPPTHVKISGKPYHFVCVCVWHSFQSFV